MKKLISSSLFLLSLSLFTPTALAQNTSASIAANPLTTQTAAAQSVSTGQDIGVSINLIPYGVGFSGTIVITNLLPASSQAHTIKYPVMTTINGVTKVSVATINLPSTNSKLSGTVSFSVPNPNPSSPALINASDSNLVFTSDPTKTPVTMTATVTFTNLDGGQIQSETFDSNGNPWGYSDAPVPVVTINPITPAAP